MYKNQSGQNITFLMLSIADRLPVTGITPTVDIIKDNGIQFSGSGSMSEKGNGVYNYGPTQSETNASCISFLFQGTGAESKNENIYPEDMSIAHAANLIQIDGLATSGTNASLNLKQLNIVNDNGIAFNAESNSTTAVRFLTGAASTGSALNINSWGIGPALGIQNNFSSTSAVALQVVGRTGAIRVESGWNTAGSVVNSGSAFVLNGAGSQPAILATGGATGRSAVFRGGSTSGDSIEITTTNGDGIKIDAAGSDKLDLNFSSISEDGLHTIAHAVNSYLSIFDEVNSASSIDYVIGTSELSSVNDFYKYATIVFTTGDMKGIARRISSYNGSTKTITVDKNFPAAPDIGDSFLILGLIL
jgi:hypothetical protein